MDETSHKIDPEYEGSTVPWLIFYSTSRSSRRTKCRSSQDIYTTVQPRKNNFAKPALQRGKSEPPGSCHATITCHVYGQDPQHLPIITRNIII